MARKYNQCLIRRASDEWEQVRVPTMFNVADVASHRPHSLVFMFVPKGEHVYVPRHGAMHGPIWAQWQTEAKEWVAFYADPRQEATALLYARDCISEPIPA